MEQAARWLTVAQHQAEPLQLSPQQRQSCQEQLALYRRLEDADEIHREMLDREREQAQTVAAAAVGKDLPAAEDIEVVFAEYTTNVSTYRFREMPQADHTEAVRIFSLQQPHLIQTGSKGLTPVTHLALLKYVPLLRVG